MDLVPVPVRFGREAAARFLYHLLPRPKNSGILRAGFDTSRLFALHRDDFEQLIAQHLYASRGLERETSRRMINIQRAGQ